MFTMSYDGRNFYKSSGFFYQSTMILNLQSIRLKEYTKFVTHHFQKNGKYINKNVISEIYQLFDGIICYIRSMIVFLSFGWEEH